MSNQLALKAISRILDIFISSEAEIRPHFMLTGPSGSGKSHTVQSLDPSLIPEGT